MIEGMYYSYDNTFWSLVDAQDGRDEIRELVERCRNPDHWGGVPFEAVPAETRLQDPSFRSYLSEMTVLYGRKLVRDGKSVCYPWSAQLHTGLSIADLLQWSENAIADELARDRAPSVFDDTSRGERVEVIRGARILGEVRTLMQDLRALDFDVWIVSASNRWTIESFGKRFGVTADRVIGNALEVDANGVLGPALIPPSLFRHGKVEAIARDIGTMPSLVFGDSVTDYEMMAQATELAV